MGLSNYELVLLDNLIYLKSVTSYFRANKKATIGDIVNYFLYENGDDKNAVGTGKIKEDCINKNTEKEQCSMSLQEWIDVLQAIKNDDTLCDLEIHKAWENGTTHFRAMTLVGTDENIIIFRGTSSAPEWVDNGQGGYSEITNNQADALNYVNSIDLV